MIFVLNCLGDSLVVVGSLVAHMETNEVRIQPHDINLLFKEVKREIETMPFAVCEQGFGHIIATSVF